MSTVVGNKEAALCGTSQAAPLVTLTAATLFGKRPFLTALDVKARILESCDYDANLTNFVRHGCTLNMAKAASVDWDIVELTNHRLIRGTLQKASFGMMENGQQRTVDAIHSHTRRVWTSAGNVEGVLIGIDHSFTTGSVTPTAVIVRLATDEPSDMCQQFDSTTRACVLRAADVKDVVFGIR